MDLGILQETKPIKCIYTHESNVYNVVATKVLSAHIGSVTIFYRMADHFLVRAFQAYRANVFSFQLALGYRRWFIVGRYVAPDDA